MMIVFSLEVRSSVFKKRFKVYKNRNTSCYMLSSDFILKTNDCGNSIAYLSLIFLKKL